MLNCGVNQRITFRLASRFARFDNPTKALLFGREHRSALGAPSPGQTIGRP